MYTVNRTIDDCIDALAAYVAPFIPNGEMVRAQANRVPHVPTVGAVFTELLLVDLETPSFKYETDKYTFSTPKRLDVQVDIYADLAGEYANAIKSTMRTWWAVDQFPEGIKPLYCSDAVQAPFISGENQYNSRWVLTISLQYNSAVQVPQDSANTVSIEAASGNFGDGVTGETGLIGIL